MRSEPLNGSVETELLARVREGDIDAFAALYDAQHRSAVRLSTILAGAEAAEELVADAMSRVLEALRAGGGPTSNFRAYLHTTIRNLHRDHIRRSRREQPASDQPWLLDEVEPGVEHQHQQRSPVDDSAAVSALTSLPDSWQTVLWHLEVEGRKPAEVASMLTLSPAAVSSLAYRAREGLRQAYLSQHLATSVAVAPARAADCGWVLDRLGQFVRKGLARRATDRVTRHLGDCASCQQAFEELTQVNRRLAGALWPFVLAGGITAVDHAGSDGDKDGPDDVRPGQSGAGAGAAAASLASSEGPGSVPSAPEGADGSFDPGHDAANGARAQSVDTASGKLSVPRPRRRNTSSASTTATGQAAGSALVAELLRRTAPVVAGAGVLGMAGPGAAAAMGLTSAGVAPTADGAADGSADGTDSATDGTAGSRADGANHAGQVAAGAPAAAAVFMTPDAAATGTSVAGPPQTSAAAGMAGAGMGGAAKLRSRAAAAARRPAMTVMAVAAALVLVAVVAWSVERAPSPESVATTPVDATALGIGGGAGAGAGTNPPGAPDVPPAVEPDPPVTAPVSQSLPPTDPGPGDMPAEPGGAGTPAPTGGGDGGSAGGALGSSEVPPPGGGDAAPTPDPGDPLADQEVTPVAPARTAITTCDEYGAVTLPTTTGVAYALTQGDGRQGAWAVTATPEPGYVFPDGAQSSWSGDLGEHLICVTLVRPTIVKITTCGEYGSVTWPSITGVEYTRTSGDGKQGPWEVKAFPTDGYQLVRAGAPIPAGYKWSGDLGTYTPCAATEVTPVAPVAAPISTCGTVGSVALPSTTGVVYALTQGDGQQGAWTVTATPESGYVFPSGAQTNWSGDLGTRYACPTVGGVTVTQGTTPPGESYDVYDVSVPVTVEDPASLTLDVAMTFDSQIFLQGYAPAWTCRYGGSVIPNGTGEFTFPVPTEIVCSIDYTPGSAIPPLTFDLHMFGGAPTGSAQARVGGTPYNTQTF